MATALQPLLASYLRIEGRELEAGGLNQGRLLARGEQGRAAFAALPCSVRENETLLGPVLRLLHLL